MSTATRPVTLTIPSDLLPQDGRYKLTWRLSAATSADIREYFVDAHDGSIVFDYSVMERQAAVGQARGVLGDTKKISVSGST